MKQLLFICTLMIAFGMTGIAGASTYYESYEGSQYVSQWSPDYRFHFDIDLADNGRTNSSLAFTNDAVGFEWWNDEQLSSVQIAVDLFSTDAQPEAFDLEVNIYWSDADFVETVLFNASGSDSTYHFTYDFNQQQIDGWEAGGWGTIVIDAFNIYGCGNFNDFRLDRVALTADSGDTAPVPEPSTFILLGAGIVGLATYRRKK